MNAKQKEIIHLLNRAAFGPSTQNLADYINLSRKEAVDKLFADSEKWLKLNIVPKSKFGFIAKMRSTLQDKLVRRRELRDYKQKLNFEWLNQLAFSPAQLRERMAFFWHDHFACNVDNALMHQQQINIIREHSLEYFGDLVIKVGKDPAMISYLHGNKNVKEKPNENFGRELLELFTIGEGNYSEADIQEASRAFTGWKFKRNGKFYIDPKLHDNGSKTFMGRSDYFTGEDIMNLIFENPKTGHYIISKIYYYLTGTVIKKNLLNKLGKTFYKSGYHIGTLVREILLSDGFYSSDIIGIKIKSPVELLTGIMRITQLQFDNASASLDIQRKLGQALFYPPNVSGWVSGRNWLDLASLAERLNLTKKLLKKPKKTTKTKKQVTQEGLDIHIDEAEKVTVIKHNLKQLEKYFHSQGQSISADAIADILYPVSYKHIKRLITVTNKRMDNKQTNLKSALTVLMSQPEYQLS